MAENDNASPSKWRDRKFIAVLYPDDPTHASAIQKLKEGGYNFAAALHDKDVWADDPDDDCDESHDTRIPGQLKKPHWHVVIKFANPVWSLPLAKELGLKPNYIRYCKTLDGALAYLTHFNYPDKYQYDLDVVFGPLKTRVATLMRDDDESTRALTIFEMIRSSNGIVTYTEIFEKACKNGLYGDFRRMGNGVGWLITEHNREIEEQHKRLASLERYKEKAGNWTQMPLSEYVDRINRTGFHIPNLGGINDD